MNRFNSREYSKFKVSCKSSQGHVVLVIDFDWYVA
jgi:hypothetical protein